MAETLSTITYYGGYAITAEPFYQVYHDSETSIIVELSGVQFYPEDLNVSGASSSVSDIKYKNGCVFSPESFSFSTTGTSLSAISRYKQTSVMSGFSVIETEDTGTYSKSDATFALYNDFLDVPYPLNFYADDQIYYGPQHKTQFHSVWVGGGYY